MDVAVNLLKCGADDYVHKDELPRVVGAIESALKKSQISRSLKRERQRLAERERMFRSYFDLPVVGAAVLTPECRILEANSYFGALLGMRVDELSGLAFSKVVGDESGRVSGMLGKLREGDRGNLDIETLFLRKDGSPVPVRLSAHFYEGIDDASDFILCLVVDKSQEAILRHEVEESAHLIDSVSRLAPIAFYLLNCRTLDFEFVSEKLRRLLGPEWKGVKHVDSEFWIRKLHADSRRLLPRFVRNLARLRDDRSLVVRFRLGSEQEGYRTFLSENTVYQRDEQGDPQVAFGIFIEDAGP